MYPLLVNVNGTPDYGEPARLDDARFLLPVLGVPADPSVESADTLTSVVAPDTAKPVLITMLWPLADRPRLAPGAPGGVTPVRLVDDELAVSLAPGGRLDTLLSAADFATGPSIDPDGRVNGALCLAVDPDLLVTVNAMTAGYVVADNPDDRNSPTHPGAGQAAAAAWLDRLRTLARRMCVAPTPYAQADLDALHRVGDPGLATIATNGAGDIVDQILGVTSTRGATLLGDASLTEAAADLLNAQGPTVAIAAADCTAQDEADGKLQPANVNPHRLSDQLVTAPFDPTVGAALAGAGRTPAVAVLSGLLARRAVQARLRDGAAPGRDQRDVVARPEPRRRAAQSDSDAAAVLGSAGRRCPGAPDRAGHHNSRRPSGSAAVARGDRRRRSRRCPQFASAGQGSAARARR